MHARARNFAYPATMSARRGTAARNGAGSKAVVRRKDGLKHLSPKHASAFLGLVRAGELLDRSLNAELERQHGLTLRGFEVLLFLAVFTKNHTMPMTDLIKQAPLSQSRVSRLVADLEARELVHRGTVEGDARAVAVSLTPAGLEVFRAAQETHLGGLDRLLFSRLTSAEIDQLARITAKILRTP